MKIYFMVSDSLGWGKGTTLTEAFEAYNNSNKKMHKGQNYWLKVIRANEMADFGISDDSLNTYFRNGSEELIVSLEKIV